LSGFGKAYLTWYVSHQVSHYLRSRRARNLIARKLDRDPRRKRPKDREEVEGPAVETGLVTCSSSLGGGKGKRTKKQGCKKKN